MEQLKIDFDKIIESLNLSNENINSRKKNFNQFIENGFPNKRVEDWKFSDLNQIISSNIKNLCFYNDLEISEIDETIFIDKFAHNKIVFLNGSISKVDFIHEDDTKVLLTRDLNQNEKFKEVNPLVSLNSALTTGYIGVTVKENYSFNKPLIIYNITTKDLKSTALNLKTDIVLEKNSSLKVINLFDDNS
jgi:Fe-S cluster assembly protein SufD